MSPLAKETRQYLVWDKDGEEDTTDTVATELFQAAEGDEEERGRTTKRKAKRKSTKSKKKSESSSSSSSSDDSSNSSSSSDVPWFNQQKLDSPQAHLSSSPIHNAFFPTAVHRAVVLTFVLSCYPGVPRPYIGILPMWTGAIMSCFIKSQQRLQAKKKKNKSKSKPKKGGKSKKSTSKKDKKADSKKRSDDSSSSKKETPPPEDPKGESKGEPEKQETDAQRQKREEKEAEKQRKLEEKEAKEKEKQEKKAQNQEKAKIEREKTTNFKKEQRKGNQAGSLGWVSYSLLVVGCGWDWNVGWLLVTWKIIKFSVVQPPGLLNDNPCATVLTWIAKKRLMTSSIPQSVQQ